MKALRALLHALRNIDAVFDAYRVTPSLDRLASVVGRDRSAAAACYERDRGPSIRTRRCAHLADGSARARATVRTTDCAAGRATDARDGARAAGALAVEPLGEMRRAARAAVTRRRSRRGGRGDPARRGDASTRRGVAAVTRSRAAPSNAPSRSRIVRDRARLRPSRSTSTSVCWAVTMSASSSSRYAAHSYVALVRPIRASRTKISRRSSNRAGARYSTVDARMTNSRPSRPRRSCRDGGGTRPARGRSTAGSGRSRRSPARRCPRTTPA